MRLGDRQRRTVQALGDVLFPSLGDGDPAGSEVVPGALEELLASLAPRARREIGVALVLFELGAVPLHGRPFSRLSLDRRERYVDGWMRSRLPFRRIVYRSLRELCAIVYYQDPRTWPSIGYERPPAFDRAAP